MLKCVRFWCKTSINHRRGRPVGEYHCSLQLIETGLFQGEIGIAEHQRFPDISDSELEKAMKQKTPLADYIVTQWLLDPKAIAEFIQNKLFQFM